MCVPVRPEQFAATIKVTGYHSAPSEGDCVRVRPRQLAGSQPAIGVAPPPSPGDGSAASLGRFTENPTLPSLFLLLLVSVSSPSLTVLALLPTFQMSGQRETRKNCSR